MPFYFIAAIITTWNPTVLHYQSSLVYNYQHICYEIMCVAVSAALKYLNLLLSYVCCIRGMCGGMFRELIVIILMTIQHLF